MAAFFPYLVNCPTAAHTARSANTAGGTHTLACREGKTCSIFLPCNFQADLLYVGSKDRYTIKGPYCFF